MKSHSTPTPEQQPIVPMVEIPQAPEANTPAAAPLAAQAVTPPPVTVDGVMAAADAGGAPSTVTPKTPIGPAIAADVDVIEKEWVDKAEAIIAKTAGDPHAEEEAIEDLTIDYMKKRYDKDVAKSGDQ